jgi:cob(I)alamin adenosyltransferase
MGAALRAAGRGKKVLIARFLKTDDSGEVAAFSHLENVAVLPCRKTFGFSWNMTEEDKKEAAAYYRALFCEAWDAAKDSVFLLVLDELLAACSQGFVDERMVLECLKTKPEGLEVIITGRNPSEAMKDCADYITEMKMEKHPFEKGVPAREGIEY